VKFVTELPQDVIEILRLEYPGKSYPAAIKRFIRENNPKNGKNEQVNTRRKSTSL
jgi:hypothetical protein